MDIVSWLLYQSVFWKAFFSEYVTTMSWPLPKKLILAWLTDPTYFMESNGSLRRSQEHASEPCPEWNEFSTLPHILYH
jgi:hypothetical protein